MDSGGELLVTVECGGGRFSRGWAATGERGVDGDLCDAAIGCRVDEVLRFILDRIGMMPMRVEVYYWSTGSIGMRFDDLAMYNARRLGFVRLIRAMFEVLELSSIEAGGGSE